MLNPLHAVLARLHRTIYNAVISALLNVCHKAVR